MTHLPASDPAAPSRPGVTRETPLPPERREWAPWTLVALTVMAAGLRFYRLGYWGFGGEEVHTLRDSLEFTNFGGDRPLLFFLNHNLVAPWHALDEFGLRLLPAVFGIAAVVMVYWAGAAVVGRRTGLLAALLVVLHPWHVYWSQLARYYSLVFFLCVAYPVALYLAFRDRSRVWTLLAVLGTLVAVLAHPSSALLLGGAAPWSVWFMVRRGGTRLRRWIPAILGALALATWLGWRLWSVLIRWHQMPDAWGHHGLVLLLSYADGLLLPFVVIGLAGVAWLCLDGDRVLGGYLVATLAAPVAVLAAISYVVPVSNAYLWCTAPVLFLGAGYFLDRLSRGFRGASGALASTAIVLVLVGVFAPRLYSQYASGSRPDVRGAAHLVAARAESEDGVVGDEWWVLQHYLSTRPVGDFHRRPAFLDSTLQAVESESGRALWIVAIRRLRGGFNDQDLDGAQQWVGDRCRLEEVLEAPRLDYKQDEVQVYRCPVLPAASSEKPVSPRKMTPEDQATGEAGVRGGSVTATRSAVRSITRPGSRPSSASRKSGLS